jgi:hypothetical protein
MTLRTNGRKGNQRDLGRNDGVGSKQASLSKGLQKKKTKVNPREASSSDRRYQGKDISGQVRVEIEKGKAHEENE